ncbi:MAG: hypothetical protein N2037_14500, partial [Acidimicrobiales bacterium]|nr:hypothetical protein [Acidimicrobiales bacterium]
EYVGRLEDHEVSMLAWLEPPFEDHAAVNPVLRLRVTVAARTRRAVTLRFRGPGPDGGLRMAVPGGWIDRPRSRIYHPTFWSLNPWGVVGVDAPHALALASSWPTAVAVDDEWVDIVVARNARRERAFGFLPLLATPAAGDEPDPVVSELAIWHPSPSGLDPAALSRTARAVRPALSTNAPFELDRTDMEIAAITAAPSLDATVLRIRALSRSAIGNTVTLTVPSWIDTPGAWIADARGRRIETGDDAAPWVDNEGRLRVLIAEPYTTIVLPYRSWTT